MRKAAALAAAALAAAGCSSWNPLVSMGLQSEPLRKPTPLTEIRATVAPKAAWTASVGKSEGFRFRPDVEGGRVYTASADGIVTVLEEDTGRVAARIDAKKKISSGVEVGESKIFVGTLKGEVSAFDMAGKAVWTANVGGEVIAPVAVTKSNAIVRTSDGRISGLSTVDGKRLWVFQRPTPPLLLRSEAGVLAMAGDVVAGFPNGKLVALDGDDGKLIWEATVSLPRGATELERIADISGLPVIDGGNVCAAAFQGKVACYEIQSRNLIWSKDVSTALNLARDEKSLYLVDESGAVHALDKRTGASVWKQDKLLYRRVTAPVVSGGAVVVGDGFGYLHLLSPENGEFIGRLATDGSAIASLVPTVNGVIVQTANGSVSLVRY